MTAVHNLLLDCLHGRDLKRCHPTSNKHQDLDAIEPKKYECYVIKRKIDENTSSNICFSLESFVFFSPSHHYDNGIVGLWQKLLLFQMHVPVIQIKPIIWWFSNPNPWVNLHSTEPSSTKKNMNRVHALYEPLPKKIDACVCLKMFICLCVCFLCRLYFLRLRGKQRNPFLGLVMLWLESWTGLFREERRGCSRWLKKTYSLKLGQQLVWEETFSEALPMHRSRALLAGLG